MLAMLVAALVVGAAATGLGHLWLRAQLVEALRNDARTLAQAAIDPQLYPPLDALVQTGEHLMRVSDIRGGSFVNAIGVEQAAFGEPPVLSWANARLEGVAWRFDTAGDRFDMFIAPEELGISQGLLVRMDASGRWRDLRRRLAELGLIAVAAALTFAGIAGMVARRLVAWPLGEALARLRRAADGGGPPNPRGEGERQRRAMQLARLRMQLAACLALLEEHEGQRLPAAAEVVDGDALVAEWLSAALACGHMAAGSAAPQGLPRLRGDRHTMRRLFNLLLDAVRLRHGGERPSLVITAATRDDEVEITVRAEDGELEPESAESDEAALAIAAIAALARRAGGRLVAYRLRGAGNAVTVRLRAADAGSQSPASAAA